jgi:hypothetical protein
MSMEPKWYSTMFGFIFMGGMGLSGIAFVAAALVLLAPFRPIAEVLDPLEYKDLGNLLLFNVIFFAYVEFFQYMLIWIGNLKEEIPWYLHRLEGGWSAIALGLVAVHFFVPFFLLLFRAVKRTRWALFAVAAGLIVARFLHLFWYIHPPLFPEPSIHPLDILAPIGLGGVWVAVFVLTYRGRPVLPLHDPRFQPGFHEVNA